MSADSMARAMQGFLTVADAAVCAAGYRFSLECEKMPSTSVAGRRPVKRTREGDAPR